MNIVELVGRMNILELVGILFLICLGNIAMAWYWFMGGRERWLAYLRSKHSGKGGCE